MFETEMIILAMNALKFQGFSQHWGVGKYNDSVLLSVKMVVLNGFIVITIYKHCREIGWGERCLFKTNA
ncbi:hypothetical protein [Bartonella sp. CR84HXZ]|uniref:hypothetical protein n=1 Tax=Bartonella sp. CR84HXZ TaxID=1460997 RepID=UPI0035CF9ED9